VNWITVAWPVMGAVCLTLGLIHLLLSAQRGWHRANLMFAAAAFSVTLLPWFELKLIFATSPEAFGDALRLAHVLGATLFISMVAFVHLQYRHSSRPWLAALVIATRAGALAANFLTGVNINYQEITRLQPVLLWGGVPGVAPVGTLNPWMALGQLNILLLVVYMLDTAWRARRQPPGRERSGAIRVCLVMAVFTVMANVWRVGVITGVLDAPDILTPAFMCVVVVMSYELGGDILRSTRLAADLLRSELRLDVAIRAARVGLWNCEMAADRFWVSPDGMALLRETTPEFDRQRLLASVLPDDRAGLLLAFERAVDTGEVECEFRLGAAGPEGHRWIAVRGQLEFTADGKPLRMSGILADITRRKHDEERFQLAVEASPTAMLLIDPQGTITLANRQAEAVFGYPCEELVGQSVDTLVPMRHRHVHHEHRRGYAGNASVRMMGAGRELYALRQDGSEVAVEIALNPIGGEARLVLASIADISERKRIEREAALHRDELAHLSRVALLAELSGSLAHELNQPLTAILSNAQAATRFLNMTPPDLGEVREILVNIVESDKRAGEVIRRLRAMLRKEPANYQVLDVNEVVEDVLRIIRSDLLNRNTETVLELAPDLPHVLGDRIQIQQVLLNLLMNGADAMADEATDERRVTVRSTATPEGGIEVAVSDVGRGIPGEDIERIFSPFVTTKSSGLGLGLAVCTTIIQTHQGRLWASNNPSRGATLHFTLPPLDTRPERDEPRTDGRSASAAI
jgi:PAS domain S-box-containing protein